MEEDGIGDSPVALRMLQERAPNRPIIRISHRLAFVDGLRQRHLGPWPGGAPAAVGKLHCPHQGGLLAYPSKVETS